MSNTSLSSPKILFLAENFEGWVYQTLFYEQRAIAGQMPGSVFYGPGYQYSANYVPDIIADTFGAAKPDAVFCYVNERRLLGEPLNDQIISRYGVKNSLQVFPLGLKDVSIPKIAWINDFWHCTRDEWDRILLGNGFDVVFATYCPPFVTRDVFDSFFSKRVQQAVRFIPWPRSVNPDVFKDYRLDKKYDITLLGAMDKSFYPLRNKMHQMFSQQSDIAYFHKAHPGYDFFEEGVVLTGSAYAQMLNMSKIFAGCTGKYRIPFIKLYEALACGAALMCDRPNGAEYIGLQNSKNYIEVTEDNFAQTMKIALSDGEELAKIARNGAELILARHTVDVRAREFNEVVSAILYGKQPGGWAEMFEM